MSLAARGQGPARFDDRPRCDDRSGHGYLPSTAPG